MNKINELSVIIPVKPPEPYLPHLVKQIDDALRGVDFEILVQEEKGLTNAVVEGVKRSRYRNIAVMDADGSHNPYMLPWMLSVLEGNKRDLVIGSKALGTDETGFIRKIISAVYRGFARNILSLKISDPMSGFVVGRREVFLNLKPSNDYKFLLQLLIYPFLKVKEIPIVFEKRKAGESKASLLTGLRTFHSILKIWWMLK